MSEQCRYHAAAYPELDARDTCDDHRDDTRLYDLARTFADRIIGMRAGKVVFDGTADEADDAVFEDIYGRSLRADDVAAAPPVTIDAADQA